jgi:hypothetical protein
MKIKIKIKKFLGPTRALIRPCVMFKVYKLFKMQVKEEAKYNEWLRRQALLEEEEEERREAARKLDLHRHLDAQLRDKTVAVHAKKADVAEERLAVDAVIHQVLKFAFQLELSSEQDFLFLFM